MKNVTKEIKILLVTRPCTRNSDLVLYDAYLDSKGYNTMNLPVATLFALISNGVLPSFETVGRCRRKVVECNPELAGDSNVEGGRSAKELEWEAYAREVFV